MLPGIDPKKMQAMMKQMGISQTDIDATQVTIEKSDGSKIIINNPSVQKVKMQGQESFQITGDISEEGQETFKEEDVEMVMEKTGCTEEQARKVLESTNGNIADAIMELNGE